MQYTLTQEVIVGSKGTTYSTSSKQKLNTTSSTEAEIVAIDDSMAHLLWTRHFLCSTG